MQPCCEKHKSLQTLLLISQTDIIASLTSSYWSHFKWFIMKSFVTISIQTFRQFYWSSEGQCIWSFPGPTSCLRLQTQDRTATCWSQHKHMWVRFIWIIQFKSVKSVQCTFSSLMANDRHEFEEVCEWIFCKDSGWSDNHFCSHLFIPEVQPVPSLGSSTGNKQITKDEILSMGRWSQSHTYKEWNFHINWMICRTLLETTRKQARAWDFVGGRVPIYLLDPACWKAST